MTVALRLVALVAALDLSLHQQEAYNATMPDIMLQAVLIRRRLSTRALRKQVQTEVRRNVMFAGSASSLGDMIETERRIAQHIDQLLPRLASSSDLQETMLHLRAEVDEAMLSLRLIEKRQASDA